MRRGVRWLAIFGAVWWAGSVGAQIEKVTLLTAKPREFERVDFLVMLKGHWVNPYRQEEAELRAELLSPSGKSVTAEGFFEEGSSDGLSKWRLRWTPMEWGVYKGFFILTNGG